MAEDVKPSMRHRIKMCCATAVPIVSALAAVVTLFIMWWAAESANEISDIQNELAETQNALTETQTRLMDKQVLIEKTSYTPEFVYLGPKEKVVHDDSTNSEEYYDYGFAPRIAKVSGFTQALSCEAHDHYELEIIPVGSSGEFPQKIAVDIYGYYSEPSSLPEGSSIVMTMEEARTKFSPIVLSDELERRGYLIKQVRSFCVGHISYIDVTGETQVKTFNMDLKKKTNAQFDTNHDTCCGNPIILRIDQLDRSNEPNRGITDTVIESWTTEIVKRVENQMVSIQSVDYGSEFFNTLTAINSLKNP